ncbi:hypothetical protein QFZ40_002220 [Arthrobacter pascens]|nr:hypothetical protein [Arthrobacter pascens]
MVLFTENDAPFSPVRCAFTDLAAILDLPRTGTGEKRFLGFGGRRVSRGCCRRWKLVLDPLYLLSLMGLRAEDFVRDSEEFPAALVLGPTGWGYVDRR